MKELIFSPEAKLIPARNRVLVFSGGAQWSLEGEQIMAQLGWLAPLLSCGIERAELMRRLPIADQAGATDMLDMLCQRGVVVEREPVSDTALAVQQRLTEPHVTFIGHATLLIKTCGLNILTDPWLFVRDRHIDRQPYPVSFDDLPPIDLICVSHMHGDHLHLPTLLRLDKQIPVVVPHIEEYNEHNRNLKNMLAGLGFKNIVSLRVWAQFNLGGVTVTRTPCHRAWTLTEQATWLIESPEITLFCGGDMFEDEHFMRQLGDDYRVDLAFLPISGYAAPIGHSPLKALRPVETHEQIYRDVMGIEEAVQATKWIRPKFAVGYANGGAYWYKHPECSITGGAAEDFVTRLQAENPAVKGLDMRPGDIWEHKPERLHRYWLPA